MWPELSEIAEYEVVVEIPPQFTEYIDAALLRLQGLFPRCRFARVTNSVAVQLPGGLSEDQMRGTVAHAVYREKIYAETLAMRHSLVSAVMG
ncbi:hypothetical protein AA2016_6303 (plasmid) [Aminobacter aminovorans]|jgi:hypothetical protein|uniref:Uncharacterized protein n=1 Tax=Aminobacter aminovorans TaxID=83263 RepID=A0AAC8YW95_AMIAI|nr:hypothetical protein AA2016_6303 [Aminobacter aminovorans]